MLRKAIYLSLVGLTAGLFSLGAFAGGVGGLAKFKLWSVNIIAYENCPQTDNANRISVLANFTDILDTETNDTLTLVDIDKTNKIFLVPGDSFAVLDSNACDDGGDQPGAILQLAVDPDQTVYYDLWIRLVGPMDTGIEVQICATDPADNYYVVCETDNYVRVRDSDNKKPTFTNATNQLLKFKGDSLFSSDYENYFWGWNTSGKPHAQLWFVESGAGL